MFHPKPKLQAPTAIVVQNQQQVNFTIQGMTCEGCELEVNNEVSKLKGVTAYNASYALKNCLVTFDKSIVDIKTIESAINQTGYSVKGHKRVTGTK